MGPSGSSVFLICMVHVNDFLYNVLLFFNHRWDSRKLYFVYWEWWNGPVSRVQSSKLLKFPKSKGINCDDFLFIVFLETWAPRWLVKEYAWTDGKLCFCHVTQKVVCCFTLSKCSFPQEFKNLMGGCFTAGMTFVKF